MMRFRRNAALREMSNEIHLDPSSFIFPVFIDERIESPEPIDNLPSQKRQSIRSISSEVEDVISLGIPAILLFGITKEKNYGGSNAYDKNGIIQSASRIIKDSFGDSIVLISDACLCMYTTHGHCGVIENECVVNDLTLDVLKKIAVSQAEAGIDVIAPSSMTDGQVMAIRGALDEAGFRDVMILSYSAKFASNFYGPFRGVAESVPSFGDRAMYQLSPANLEEAIREVGLDIREGADMVMVKPALSYLDVLRDVKERFKFPTAAFNVSGEYLMLKTLIEMGLADEKSLVMEVMMSIRRAGADSIISYFAKDVVRWILDDVRS